MMRFCIAVCGWVLSWIITTPRLHMTHWLFWIIRCNFWSVLQQTPALIVEHCGKKSTSRTPFLSQNILQMTFQVQVVCLNFVFVGDELRLQSMDCCFNSGTSCDTHVSFPVTTRFKKFSPSSLYCVRKSKVVACCSNLCSSASMFGTQFAHNFRNLTLPDTIWWRSEHEIWGKCRESDVMVNRLFSLILPSNARNVSSFTTDNRPLHKSSHTFVSFIKQSHRFLYQWTTHGIFSTQVTKLTNFSWFHVLHIQEMDYRPHFMCGGILFFLNIINTTRCVDKLFLCLATESTNSARTCTIMTVVLNWQY